MSVRLTTAHRALVPTFRTATHVVESTVTTVMAVLMTFAHLESALILQTAAAAVVEEGAQLAEPTVVRLARIAAPAQQTAVVMITTRARTTTATGTAMDTAVTTPQTAAAAVVEGAQLAEPTVVRLARIAATARLTAAMPILTATIWETRAITVRTPLIPTSQIAMVMV
jgi:hypothetical protein